MGVEKSVALRERGRQVYGWGVAGSARERDSAMAAVSVCHWLPPLRQRGPVPTSASSPPPCFYHHNTLTPPLHRGTSRWHQDSGPQPGSLYPSFRSLCPCRLLPLPPNSSALPPFHPLPPHQSARSQESRATSVQKPDKLKCRDHHRTDVSPLLAAGTEHTARCWRTGSPCE